MGCKLQGNTRPATARPTRNTVRQGYVGPVSVQGELSSASLMLGRPPFFPFCAL